MYLMRETNFSHLGLEDAALAAHVAKAHVAGAEVHEYVVATPRLVNAAIEADWGSRSKALDLPDHVEVADGATMPLSVVADLLGATLVAFESAALADPSPHDRIQAWADTQPRAVREAHGLTNDKDREDDEQAKRLAAIEAAGQARREEAAKARGAAEQSALVLAELKRRAASGDAIARAILSARDEAAVAEKARKAEEARRLAEAQAVALAEMTTEELAATLGEAP